VTWNQAEINVNYTKAIYFASSDEEDDAYFGRDLRHIFSVSVHE
jgi:hypothetical protein